MLRNRQPVGAHLHVAVKGIVVKRGEHELGPQVLLHRRLPAQVALLVGVDGRVVVLGHDDARVPNGLGAPPWSTARP